MNTPTFSFRRLLRWSFVILLLLFFAEAARVTLGTNRHTVIPGKIYRCSQPSGDSIRELVEDRGIRTVLNLRGISPGFEWYQSESEATHECNISQEDVTLSANSLPPPAELRRVIEVLDHSDYPILIHCKAGADRTGLVSTLALLLYTDATLAEAKWQLLPFRGHFRFGRTAAMDEFFEIYEAWLEQRQETHSPALFRQWALQDYRPGPACSTLTWAEPPQPTYPAGQPIALQVQAQNDSNVPWELKPGKFASVHVAFVIFNVLGQDVQSGRTGLRRETVLPGESTTIIVPIAPLPPGEYKLIVEMHDSTEGGIPFRTNSFVKFGDGSLVQDLVFVAK